MLKDYGPSGKKLELWNTSMLRAMYVLEHDVRIIVVYVSEYELEPIGQRINSDTRRIFFGFFNFLKDHAKADWVFLFRFECSQFM